MSLHTFKEEEIQLLGQTADALSAFLGRHVLAQLDQVPEGYEWVAFACPMDKTQSEEAPITQIQMGGPTARLIGSNGGLGDIQEEMYLCQFLYAIQITDDPQARFVRINEQGEIAFFSNELSELLPFTLEPSQSMGHEHKGCGCGCGCGCGDHPETQSNPKEQGCGGGSGGCGCSTH